MYRALKRCLFLLILLSAVLSYISSHKSSDAVTGDAEVRECRTPAGEIRERWRDSGEIIVTVWGVELIRISILRCHPSTYGETLRTYMKSHPIQSRNNRLNHLQDGLQSATFTAKNV